ncbi:hypothetical protein C8R46DRAFT_1185476 [Mycena filopes]|nr:hypothetical protein C8R46DRAFT_1185476 [Mycena filopes]
MVASKTKLVIKYTYAERVLGSFSQIQREHKKHAVHLASLRAQIQKTATARKDKLGPHWRNWVTKAVHRLEEDGILEADEPGTVALTPDGKKAILAARRVLALPAHDSLSSTQEDQLWKQVTHPNLVKIVLVPTSGKRATRHADHSNSPDEEDSDDDEKPEYVPTKSRRRSLTAPKSKGKVVIVPTGKRARHAEDDEEDSDDDDEPEYVPPKSRKRPRTSLAATPKSTPKQTNNPAFKLTKAQLVEQVAILQRAREADRLRAMSPLTELEDDDESEELMRLKEILKHKDEEMHALQSALLAANRDSSSDAYMSSSPIRPNPAPVNIMRTQSGSFIDHLSKQPTPAPTERDPSDDDDDGDMNMFDEPGPDLVQSVPRVAHAHPLALSHSLVTPEATPAKNQQQKTPMNSNQISSLEHAHALQLRTTSAEPKLQQQQQQHLEHKLAALEAEVSDKDARISSLQTSLALAEKNDTRLVVLEQAKAGLEASVAEDTRQIAILLRERDQAVERLEEGKEELGRLRGALSASEQVAARVETLEAELMRVRTALDGSAAERARLEGELAEARREGREASERARLEGELAEARREGREASERATELDRRVLLERNAVEAASIKQQQVARAEAEAELAAACGKLATAETKAEGLEARLMECEGKLAEARKGVEDARAGAEALRPQMKALDEALTMKITEQRELVARFDRTKQEADNLRVKIGILESGATQLRASLGERTSEVERLARELQGRVEENVALNSTLEARERELGDERVARGRLEVEIGEVGGKLEGALREVAVLGEAKSVIGDQLVAVDAAKASLIIEVAAMSTMAREMGDKLRDAEIREGALGSQVEGMQSEIGRLRGALEGALGRVREGEEKLGAAEGRYASDVAEKEGVCVRLEKELGAVRADVVRLTREAGELGRARDEMQGRLEGDVRRISDVLAAEALRGKRLEMERDEANGRVGEVEEALLELRASKDADEATIGELRGVFSQLKAAQMQTLAEMDDKVESAHSTPVPRRRGTKVSARSSA